MNQEQAKKALADAAKSGCKHCYGRGYVGWDEKGIEIVCRCVYARMEKEGYGG